MRGDEVAFFKDIWEGSRRKPKWSGLQLVVGKIERESYGKEKQQHTFSIKTKEGLIRIKGRNLYRHGVLRKPWKNEKDREIVASEKHFRGDIARENRFERKNNE